MSDKPWESDEQYIRLTLWFVYACIIYSIIGFSWGSLMGGVPEFRRFVDERMFGKMIVLAHSHINLLGWVEMAIFSAVYFTVPRLVKRPIYSVTLMKVHFWMHNFGLLGLVIFFTIAGLLGGINSLSMPPDQVEALVRPWLEAVGMFGSLVLLANCIWGYNIYRTAWNWDK